MTEAVERSPRAIFLDHLRSGRLAYQVSAADGAVVFPPRLIAPGTGATDLEWRFSAGAGAVYAITINSMRGEGPYNVALVDLDEGFRMLARIEEIASEAVTIGLRVELRVRPGEGEEPPVAVFVPAEAAG